MYLSSLEIDVSGTRGRTWLANPYRVHQRLCLAFPDEGGGRVLFRIEDGREPPRIVVQSQRRADWERAFRDHPVLIRPPVQKEVSLKLQAGQRLRFLLRANPTVRRIAGLERGADGKTPMGRRVGLLKEEEQRQWLARKGEAGGFVPLAYEVRSAGQIGFRRGAGGDAPKQTHLSVDFEGYLEVADPALFQATIEQGIGTAKGFGFGLLSVARG